ncbi:carboxypeptidase M32 [Bacillus sp. WMMC1349]|uniref:carboxypeptidase M32 n=1 Tax=Bacillus sp. WMMC1349 TaxID=2736254 RepID=UPI001551FFCC|nr:carboxypeptidase M32 [Bacillus sp. WMMC1349]NPC92704.1 carboxypeptidase M32 [Bacillus sp. WMMC1349]
MSLLAYEKEFLETLQKISKYEQAYKLMYWDMRTGTPKKAREERFEAIGQLSADIYQMKTSARMNELLTVLFEQKERLPEDTLRALEEAKKEYERNKTIPEHEFKEYMILKSKAESVWEEAKKASDFSLFSPYLKKLIEYNKRFITYWGYDGHPYNALLDLYEPGVTVDTLDQLFAELRKSIVPLVQKIADSPNKPDTSFVYKHFPKERQRELCHFFLEKLGYDFDAGRLDESVHPFQVTINSGDARVTTSFNEGDFRSAIFGTIHECGHAIYEQNIDKALSGTNLFDGASMGIHESQSLFYENFIARHLGFWKQYFHKMKEASPQQFEQVTADGFYRAVNESKPSLIRTEADELTYPLHIMIRYEIEKAIYSDEVSVEELPSLWNEKYETYLGITPPHDAQGILQDVHWSDGSFGYFPSYALGYMYAAQLRAKLLEELPEFDQFIEKGNFQPIRKWLTERVHIHGKRKKPLDIIKNATGEELNISYLIDYLEEKYTALYL